MVGSVFNGCGRIRGLIFIGFSWIIEWYWMATERLWVIRSEHVWHSSSCEALKFPTIWSTRLAQQVLWSDSKQNVSTGRLENQTTSQGNDPLCSPGHSFSVVHLWHDEEWVDRYQQRAEQFVSSIVRAVKTGMLKGKTLTIQKCNQKLSCENLLIQLIPFCAAVRETCK